MKPRLSIRSGELRIGLVVAGSSVAFTSWVAIFGLPDEYNRLTATLWDIGIFTMLPGMLWIRGHVGNRGSTFEWLLEIAANGITWFSITELCVRAVREIRSFLRSPTQSPPTS